MTVALPPQDLECLDPENCPVATRTVARKVQNGSIPRVTVDSTRMWFRVYDAQDGHSQPNPGFGDTRFAPFDAETSGHRVPTMYLAESMIGALLETSLHDVHAKTPRIVRERDLFGKLHARVKPPRDLELVDLRDPQLATLNLRRSNVSSSPPEHYPCTRKVARSLHSLGCDGIIWHSRQAELTNLGPSEAAVVFCDRVDHTRGSWSLAELRSSSGSLLEGTGRFTLEKLANYLGITIVPDDSL